MVHADPSRVGREVNSRSRNALQSNRPSDLSRRLQNRCVIDVFPSYRQIKSWLENQHNVSDATVVHLITIPCVLENRVRVCTFNARIENHRKTVHAQTSSTAAVPCKKLIGCDANLYSVKHSPCPYCSHFSRVPQALGGMVPLPPFEDDVIAWQNLAFWKALNSKEKSRGNSSSTSWSDGAKINQK